MSMILPVTRCFAPAAALLACTLASAASAQVRLDRPVARPADLGRVVVPTNTLPQLKPTPIVTNPDGSFVSDIDGKRRNFGFRPGSIHSIRGKGFGRKASSSVILLKSDDGRYAAPLSVTRWEDDLIVAQVPTGQSGFPSADALSLVIMTGPGGGGPRQFVVKGGRYAAEEAEQPLPLTSGDQSALIASGLRWRVWNVGKEVFVFERDGGITVTHYIDYPKDRRTTPCPGPGSERINLTKLERALGLRSDFRISRIAMTHAQSKGHFTGRYGNAWHGVDGTMFYVVDWGVWRFRRDASFDLFKPFDVTDMTFGKHTAIPNADRAFAGCGAEFTLNLFVTGPRGLRPR